jgi:transcriptional antiterminator Rof (Rho-off)
MVSMDAYDEIIELIAASKPTLVANFEPSEKMQNRVNYLIDKEKEEELTLEEKDELEHYLYLDHIMRLAKIRARKLLRA